MQSGGHGPLAAAHGLAADNVLEFEVVVVDFATASGRSDGGGGARRGPLYIPSVTPHGEHADLYWALAGGFLSGKYRSKQDMAGKARERTVAKYMTDQGFAVLDAVEAVARGHGVAPAQVALAWVMAKPGVTAAIASATSLEQLRDLAAAARLPLSPQDVATLDAASAA